MAKVKRRTGGVRNVIKLAEYLESKGVEPTYTSIMNLAFQHNFGGHLGGYSNISPADISQYFRFKESGLDLDKFETDASSISDDE